MLKNSKVEFEMGTIEESIIVSIVPWDYVFLSFSLMIPKLEAMGPHAFFQ